MKLTSNWYLLIAVNYLSTIYTGIGKIGEVNVWDYPISAQFLNVLTCGPTGNIVTWATLSENGTSNRYYNESFERCGMLISINIVSAARVHIV